jgi:TIR domain-containing protein
MFVIVVIEEFRSISASMGQKFFISFNSADRTKAHWIAWTLKEAGHEVAVHDWEIPAGGNVPLWMSTKLAWADRLIAVVSPDYAPARYSPMEWASQIWKDPDGTKGSVIPVIVKPTSKMPPLLEGLSRIDLTNCSEEEARRRLIKGVDMPAPPKLKPAFEEIEGEPPDSQHVGPAEKPIFVRVSDKPSAAIASVVLAVFAGGISLIAVLLAEFWIEPNTGGGQALLAIIVFAVISALVYGLGRLIWPAF